MFGNQYDYLKISSSTAKSIIHNNTYIKEGYDRVAIRRIFKNVPYDDFELQQIIAFKKAIMKYEIRFNPETQTDDVLLRYLYAGHFNLSNSLELFKGYMNWLSLHDPFSMNAKAQKFLDEGMIYLAGRDKQYRPSIVINAYLLDYQAFDSDAFLRALYTLLAICEDYMFYPGKVENIIVFIEAKEMNLIGFPYRLLQLMILQIQQNFPMMLEKLYLFNPSKSLLQTWDYISTHIDTKTLQKIELVRADMYSPTANNFDPAQVEERFGGALRNIQQFWMPLNTIVQPTRSEPEWRYEKKNQPEQPQLADESEIQNYQFYQEPSLIQEGYQVPQKQSQQSMLSHVRAAQSTPFYPQKNSQQRLHTQGSGVANNSNILNQSIERQQTFQKIETKNSEVVQKPNELQKVQACFIM